LKPLSRTTLATITTIALGTTAAVAECSAPSAAPAIQNDLPVTSASGAQELAAFALPYSLMIGLSADGALSPPGFARGPGPAEILPLGGGQFLADLSGIPAATFVSCESNSIVVAFDGVGGFDPRQYLAAILRRTDGGYSEVAVAYVDAVREAFPDHYVSVIGHSEGGNMASYAAGMLGLPSITFNASRTEASTTINDGGKQLNVIVRGDPIADPTGEQGLPGLTLYLDVVADNLHTIETVRAGLIAVAGL
jgi:hypothetical protein